MGITISIYHVGDAFAETQHPRASSGPHGGEFVKKGSSTGAPKGATAKPAQTTTKPAETPAPAQGASVGHAPAKKEGGKFVTETGEPLPAHLSHLRIPPAWTDVTYATDPKAALIVKGKDAAGRVQYVYSEEHSSRQAEAKFARIKELDRKFATIRAENEQARRSDTPAIKDAADIAALIMHTGIRPGSDTDTKAQKKAYGATTLLGKHVVEEGDGVTLKFTGKKGVDLTIPVDDPELVGMLKQRRDTAGADGQLFPRANEKTLLDHVHTLGGGGFKSKDFRTYVGTRTAIDEVNKMPAPTSPTAYKKAVMQVAKTVSAKLGNTPTIALQAYISPTAFAPWRNAMGS
jgi:DNA topoisomerase I